MCDAESGKAILSRLLAKYPEEFNVFAIDLPGHNGLPFTASGGMSSIVKHIESEVKRLGLTEFYIAGFSFGGLCAIEYAKKNKVSGLIVIASPVSKFYSSLSIPVRVVRLVFNYMPSQLFDYLKKISLINTEFKKIGINYLHKLKKDELLALVLVQAELSPYLLPTNVPSLYIYSPKDLLLSNKNIEYVKRRVGNNIGLEIVKNGGHFYSREGLEKLNELVADFCR